MYYFLHIFGINFFLSIFEHRTTLRTCLAGVWALLLVSALMRVSSSTMTISADSALLVDGVAGGTPVESAISVVNRELASLGEVPGSEAGEASSPCGEGSSTNVEGEQGTSTSGCVKTGAGGLMSSFTTCSDSQIFLSFSMISSVLNSSTVKDSWINFNLALLSLGSYNKTKFN